MFAFGWAWPGLFNLSVVRDNPSAPAAATGVTQTGIYIGAGGGPVLGGMIVRTAGFSALWVSASFGLLIAAVAALCYGSCCPQPSGALPLLPRPVRDTSRRTWWRWRAGQRHDRGEQHGDTESWALLQGLPGHAGRRTRILLLDAQTVSAPERLLSQSAGGAQGLG